MTDRTPTAETPNPCRRRPPRWLPLVGRWLLAGLALTGPLSTTAQTSPEAPEWYQIELIIFARDPSPTANPELWHQILTPSYPENLRVLKQYQPPTLLQNRANGAESDTPEEHDAEPMGTTTPEFGPAQRSNSFSQFDVNAEPLANREEEQEPFSPIDLNRLPKRLAPPDNLARDPYILLPYRYFELNNLDQRIRQAPDMRLLQHVAWRQTVAGNDLSDPIFIQTGDQYGLSFEVEGMLALKKNRYLHIDTDLLYSRFKRKLLNDGVHWEIFTQDTPTSEFDGYRDVRIDSFTLLNEEASEYQAELTAPFRQTRRVTAGELHYLDHPLLGMLIKVSAYQPPDPVLEMPDFDLDALPKRKPAVQLPAAPTAGVSPAITGSAH